MLIVTKNLWKTYVMGTEQVHALRGVDLQVEKGEYLAIMGSSGSGKSTLMNLIGCLDTPTEGEYILNDKSVSGMNDDELAYIRNKEIGFVFQTFNLLPRATALRNVELPLIYNSSSGKDRAERAKHALEAVDLGDRIKHKPNELSGGQRQRVAIARTLVMKPSFIVADEPISMLDVSIRAGILKVMLRAGETGGISYIFVTHDLAYARHICHRGAIMYLGKIVEMAPIDELVKNPLHPYTIALMTAVPIPDPRLEKARAIIGGEVPTPIDPPSGCRFHPRCSKCVKICRDEEPVLYEAESGHYVACHTVR